MQNEKKRKKKKKEKNAKKTSRHAFIGNHGWYRRHVKAIRRQSRTRCKTVASRRDVARNEALAKAFRHLDDLKNALARMYS